jgi:hypothetical protein
MSQGFESSYGGDGSKLADDTVLECGICWWVYDPALGDEANQIPLVIRSGGYGSSRVFATGLRHVWAVQYVNGMGNVILDTLEVGGVPVSVLAAKEDFQDSAERLAEILQAFTS